MSHFVETITLEAFSLILGQWSENGVNHSNKQILFLPTFLVKRKWA